MEGGLSSPWQKEIHSAPHEKGDAGTVLDITREKAGQLDVPEGVSGQRQHDPVAPREVVAEDPE